MAFVIQVVLAGVIVDPSSTVPPLEAFTRATKGDEEIALVALKRTPTCTRFIVSPEAIADGVAARL